MSDPRPTLAEGVTLVEGGQPITARTFNYAADWINKQQGIRPPTQITGERRGRGRADAGAVGLGWAIIVGLGDVNSMWVTVRVVTLNEAADGYDVGAEDVIAMTPPGLQDTEKYFGRFLVDPIPGTLTGFPEIQVMETALVGGVLYVFQTNRMAYGPIDVDAERSECGAVNL